MNNLYSTVLLAVAISIAPFYPVAAQEQAAQSVKCCPDTVIFDLGNVLIEASKASALWLLGPRTLFSYFIHNRSIDRMKKTFYALLNRIDGSDENPYGAKDPEGTVLPNLLACWMRGAFTSNDILHRIEREITDHPDWFQSPQEQQLMRHMSQLVFNPQNFVQTSHPIKEMIAFARECKQKNYRLIILSNWDAESFALIAQKYKTVFDLFDEIIISGYVHHIKPEAAMFALVTKKIPASCCIFIDDQPENIEAAQNAGMHTILVTPAQSFLGRGPDMQKIREAFARIESQCITPIRTSAKHPNLLID